MEYADVDEEKVLNDTKGWEEKLDDKRARYIEQNLERLNTPLLRP